MSPPLSDWSVYGVQFPFHQVRAERDRLLGSGEIDRCLVVIDSLSEIRVSLDPDPGAGAYGSREQVPDRVLDRRKFDVALDLWHRIAGWSGGRHDPVLAVAGVRRDKQRDISLEDVRGWPSYAATAVGRLQLPPISRYQPADVTSMDLDVTIGSCEERHRIPLLYDYDTCRFRDGESNAPLGW